MRSVPCFLYQEGEHFTLPPELGRAVRNPCVFTQTDEEGRTAPRPEVFHAVSRPEDAAFFLFPWDIGQYVDGGRGDAIEAVIRQLPFFSGRERRHIVCDDGDFTTGPRLPVRLFKISVTTDWAGDCVPMPYTLPAHMFKDAARFDWDGIRYDASFVGNATNILRRAVTASVQAQAQTLRVKVDFDDAFAVRDGYFFNTREGRDPDVTAKRQNLYRKSLAESYTVLCPPGIGPHSIRMYETMYMGRIPVLFGDNALYPLERLVAYDDFCLRVPRDAVMDTGVVLERWLRAQTKGEIREKCVLACKMWNRYFAPGVVLTHLLQEAERVFGA